MASQKEEASRPVDDGHSLFGADDATQTSDPFQALTQAPAPSTSSDTKAQVPSGQTPTQDAPLSTPETKPGPIEKAASATASVAAQQSDSPIAGDASSLFGGGDEPADASSLFGGGNAQDDPFGSRSQSADFFFNQQQQQQQPNYQQNGHQQYDQQHSQYDYSQQQQQQPQQHQQTYYDQSAYNAATTQPQAYDPNQQQQQQYYYAQQTQQAYDPNYQYAQQQQQQQPQQYQQSAAYYDQQGQQTYDQTYQNYGYASQQDGTYQQQPHQQQTYDPSYQQQYNAQQYPARPASVASTAQQQPYDPNYYQYQAQPSSASVAGDAQQSSYDQSYQQYSYAPQQQYAGSIAGDTYQAQQQYDPTYQQQYEPQQQQYEPQQQQYEPQHQHFGSQQQQQYESQQQYDPQQPQQQYNESKQQQYEPMSEQQYAPEPQRAQASVEPTEQTQPGAPQSQQPAQLELAPAVLPPPQQQAPPSQGPPQGPPKGPPRQQLPSQQLDPQELVREAQPEEGQLSSVQQPVELFATDSAKQESAFPAQETPAQRPPVAHTGTVLNAQEHEPTLTAIEDKSTETPGEAAMSPPSKQEQPAPVPPQQQQQQQQPDDQPAQLAIEESAEEVTAEQQEAAAVAAVAAAEIQPEEAVSVQQYESASYQPYESTQYEPLQPDQGEPAQLQAFDTTQLQPYEPSAQDQEETVQLQAYEPQQQGQQQPYAPEQTKQEPYDQQLHYEQFNQDTYAPYNAYATGTESQLDNQNVATGEGYSYDPQSQYAPSTEAASAYGQYTSYDGYQSDAPTKETPVQPDTSYGAQTYAPSGPASVTSADPYAPPSRTSYDAPRTTEIPAYGDQYAPRPSTQMERSTTMPATTASTSQRTPPQPNALLPCPDPNCEGENKAKAKFCCECGRPLLSMSRSTTPALQTPGLSYMQPVYGAYEPATQHHDVAQQQQPQQQLHGLGTYPPATFEGAEPATLMVDNAPTDPYAATYAPEQYPAQTISDQYGGETAAAAAAAADMYEPAGQHALPPDPLQRARGCPLVSFGFGGKLCVMFPQTVQRFTQQDGYDGGAPITKTMPSVIKIKKLRDVMDEPTVSSLSQFVGPALMDSKMGAKSKKKEVLAYMDRRINDMSALQEPHAETRVLLWRLVKLLIEKETSIGDADKTDAAVRELVQPASALETDDQGNFSVPAYAQVETRDEDAENRERAQKVLDKLQHYLLTGDRSGAVDYAMQEDLWAHALIISSCVNKDVWKNVVNNFVERELSESAGGKPRQDRYNVTGDKQALRVLYSLFAGSGGAAISEFLHKPSNTPFIGAATGGQIQVTDEQLSQWQVTLTLILANRTPHDAEAITALGDILRTHGWLAAAHICYLVAPQTSIHSGIDTPNVRLTLLGSEGGATFAQLDAYLLTELFELAVCTKQGGPAALPFLQGYKLVHAWWLADFGYLAEAQRYCEAIANAIKAYTKGSPYLHHRLLESLKEFSELCEVSGGQKLGGDAGSWLKNKLSKNSLDSLWGSLEGKFNKFVSGEDIPAEEAPVRKSTEIMANPYDAAVDGPPARSASAFDFRNANRVGVESLRRAATPTASMVSEAYMRRASSPGAHAAAGQFGRGFTPLGDSSEPQQQQQQAPYGSPSAVPDMYSYGAQPANATMSPFGHPQQQQQPSSYYGADESSYQPYQYDQPVQDHATSSYYGNDPYQPQDTQEQQPEQAPAYGTNEYGHAAPSYESYAAQTAPATTVEDDDDLGFGNSALNKPKSGLTTSEEAAPDRTQSSPPEVQSESTSGASDKDGENKEEKKGWGLFSIFSRSSTPSNQKEEKKAVKANLGEESSFYYDKEAGRWVNKTAGAQEEKPAPLPPPPKATPSKTSSPAPPPSGTSTPPPPPSGATTPGGGPPGMPRATSASSLGGPSTPPLSAMSPPPSGSGRRAGGRKPMRSRYVDVFNQPS